MDLGSRGWDVVCPSNCRLLASGSSIYASELVETLARSDLLLSLVKAGSKGDRPAFRRSLEAMVAEERDRKHHVVANQLAVYLQNEEVTERGLTQPISPTPARMLDEIEPDRELGDLVLSAEIRTLCDEFVEEQRRADLLRSHGLEPRNRMLLLGPPGNGKTSLAEAIAGELALPMLRVRYDGVIGSYLGETASRLAQVFDHARTRQCVLFFDEFDSVGKERGDEHETGEIKRVVNSLLMSIDSLPSYVVIVAASNHPELLDKAVWRRFQVRAKLEAPRPAEMIQWIRVFEERTELKLGLPEKALRSSLAGLCFAELEEFCSEVQRKVVLAGPDAKVPNIARAVLKQAAARSKARG